MYNEKLYIQAENMLETMRKSGVRPVWQARIIFLCQFVQSTAQNLPNFVTPKC